MSSASGRRLKTLIDGKAALVVDDSESVRSVVATTLRTLGYRVSEAATSTEALSIVASEDISLAISDLNLDGDMSGAVVLEQAMEVRPEMQCVLMSGSMTPGQKLRSSFPLLSKPFAPRVLVDLLENLLRQTD